MGDTGPPAVADSRAMRVFISDLFAALVLSAPATASDVHVGATIAPGSLALRAPTNARAGGKVALTVVDSRGNGAGWTLRIAAGGRNRHGRVRSTARLTPCAPCRAPRSPTRSPTARARHRSWWRREAREWGQ